MLETNPHLDAWMSGWSTPAPSTYQGSDQLAFQRWFRFKEAFSPKLVHDVIGTLPQPPKKILDCCAGSGTTGVVAQFLGIEPTLIEVNPFLSDVIEAKLSDYCDVDISFEAGALLDRAKSIKISIDDVRSRLPPTFVEPGMKERWLFDRGAAKGIERIRLSILGCKNPKVRRLFMVALGSILIEASNVRIDGKGRRYRQGWQNRHTTEKDVFAQFVLSVSNMIEDIYQYAGIPRSPYTLLRGDARKQLKKAKDLHDLAIFSPPYPNSFDYTDIYNIELWMLGYFKSSADNRRLRLNTLRSHVQVSWDFSPTAHNSPTLKKTLTALDSERENLWDKRLPEMVEAYFEDISLLLSGIKPALSENGKIAIVVGDSSYANIKIDSASIIGELADRIGLELKKSQSVRVMRSSMQQPAKGNKTLDEWLLHLQHRI